MVVERIKEKESHTKFRVIYSQIVNDGPIVGTG